jgi:soluble lytic murein transglycosylase
VGALLAVIVTAWTAIHRAMPAWYARHWYPLEYVTTIRTHAEQTGVAPELIAAVIWRESDFNPNARSSQGAVGLMQILPATAEFISTQPGGLGYSADRLAEPEVNIAFGSWYLHYLIDKYGDERVAIAAYNGGETNAAGWVKDAAAKGRHLTLDDIPFPETRAFVKSVERARAIYRRVYGDELGVR